jgi:hypothetical protein
MSQRDAFLLLFLMLGIPGCGPQSAKAPALPDVEQFGHLGKSKQGEYQCALPYWQKNNRVLFLGFAEYPGKPFGPAYFVVVGLPRDSKNISFNASPGIGHVDKPNAWIAIPQATTGGPSIEYQVLKDAHKEHFKIGETGYDLAAGRVFLLDQAAKPPVVQQLKVDLAALFAGAGAEPSREVFSAALEKLRSEQQHARAFLDKLEGK